MLNNTEKLSIAQVALLNKSKEQTDKDHLNTAIFKPATENLTGVYISVQEASKAHKFFRSWSIYIQSYFTSKLHSSFLYRKNDPQQTTSLQQHHLWKKYIDNNVSLSLVCTTTLYKFDICKLLTVEKSDEEKKQICAKFDNIVEAFLKEHDSNLKPISVGWSKICPSYLLSWIPYFGHTNALYNWTAKEVHDNFVNGKAKSMLCSEFVTRLLISCIYELEESYKNEHGHNPQKPLFKMPFSETERLETLFSSRLSHIMEKSNCFTKHTWHDSVPQA